MSGDNKTEEIRTDRPQGLLTSTEREILIHGEQFDARGREARSRIRRRLGDALLDYIILDEHLPAKDIRAVFDPNIGSDEEVRQRTEQNLVAGLKAQVRFVYRAAKASHLSPEQVIDTAVEEAKGTRIERLTRQYETDPYSLSIAELRTLRDAGELPPDEFDHLIKELIGDSRTRLEDLFSGEGLPDADDET